MIKFAEHAETRIEERNIIKEVVRETIEKPDIVLPARSNRQIAIKKFGSRFLKVVFIKEDSDIIVITNHWLSKLKAKE